MIAVKLFLSLVAGLFLTMLSSGLYRMALGISEPIPVLSVLCGLFGGGMTFVIAWALCRKDIRKWLD